MKWPQLMGCKPRVPEDLARQVATRCNEPQRSATERLIELGIIFNPRLNPTSKIKDIAVVLHPLEIVSVPVSVLGKPVASLKADAERVIGSLDDLLLRVDPKAGSRRHSRLMKPTHRSHRCHAWLQGLSDFLEELH